MRLALSTTNIEDHHRLQTDDLLSVLSIATLPSENTQLTLKKIRQTWSQKKGATLRLTDDGKLYYVGGASSKSLHVISSDNCD